MSKKKITFTNEQAQHIADILYIKLTEDMSYSEDEAIDDIAEILDTLNIDFRDAVNAGVKIVF